MVKKQLTQHEEFEIFKLVIDKLLWLGFGILAFGFYKLTSTYFDGELQGLFFVITGVITLAILIFLMIKEFEIIR
ncbi:MAG TPA: hypothetical protein VK158_02380 [Acidobacteriota bacterium]|nr:hypothetical protein [Acidobacteriota bacterium]